MGYVRGHLVTSLVGITITLAGGASSAPATDKVASGQATAAGTSLIAGAHGIRYELRGGAKVELSEGAEFAFEPSLHLKLRKPNDPDTTTRVIHLVHGRAEITVPTLRDPTAVLVRGPGKLSAVSKEGRMSFLADADSSTVAARAGELLVGVGNEWKPLKEGYARTLAADDPAALPRAILGAPTTPAVARLVVVRGSEQAHVAATWSPLATAARYDVTLTLTRAGADATVVSHQILGGTSADMPLLPPGSYAMVVSAMDKHGLVGRASAPYKIRVVGVQTPDGSTTSADGAVILGRDQRVSLVGADDLELSYGASPLFVAAPPTLGLAHGEMTTVRLRAPGSTEEAVLHLEPKGLHADVSIGPRSAKWPLDRVAIQIDLVDTSGRVVPVDEPVDATVTVNLQKIAVHWERNGRTLHATLPASTPPGPWVVRAEVRDTHGQLIGRDFLEVVQTNAHAGVVAAR
jgi:hypothetical protein